MNPSSISARTAFLAMTLNACVGDSVTPSEAALSSIAVESRVLTRDEVVRNPSQDVVINTFSSLWGVRAVAVSIACPTGYRISSFAGEYQYPQTRMDLPCYQEAVDHATGVRGVIQCIGTPEQQHVFYNSVPEGLDVRYNSSHPIRVRGVVTCMPNN